MFIDEDWEYELQKEQMYLVERQREIEDEYEQWLKEQEELDRLPAKIKILTNISKLQENDTKINSLPF